MSDLTEFLRARLDEDEAVAKDKRYVWPTDFEVTLNPARVIREVEAKRAILEEHEPDGSRAAFGDMWRDSCTSCDSLWPCQIVRLLAAVYSDHPDYRQEWKP